MPRYKRRAGTYGGPTLARRYAYRRARRGVTRQMVLRSLGRRVAIAGMRYYPYAAGAYAGYKAIQYLRKKRRKFGRSNVGMPVGSDIAKTRIFQDTGLVLKASRTLHVDEMTNIAGGQARNERERTIVNVRGFKICTYVNNRSNEPIYYNVAVLSPKQQTSVTTGDFFRSYGNVRGDNFATNLSAMEFHCLPINTDLYVVLKHKRFRLAPGAASTSTLTDNKNKSYMNLKWYIPLKRQLRYDSPTGVSAPMDGRVFYVQWADRVSSQSGQTSQAATYEEMKYITTWFRDPKP